MYNIIGIISSVTDAVNHECTSVSCVRSSTSQRRAATRPAAVLLALGEAEVVQRYYV